MVRGGGLFRLAPALMAMVSADDSSLQVGLVGGSAAVWRYPTFIR